jgi:carboxyl-terminal processing protease
MTHPITTRSLFDSKTGLRAPVGLRRSRARRFVGLAWIAAALSACGGSSGSSTPDTIGTVSGAFTQRCAPENPYRADSDAGTNPQEGTLDIEKQWVSAYVNEAYLWYDKVPAVDATLASYSDRADVPRSLDAYFAALTEIPEDRFSFTYPTKAWKALQQAGVTFGYGIELFRNSATPPRGYRIAYVEPNSPASNAGLLRGDVLVSADGILADDNTPAGVAALNAALAPTTATAHAFVFSRNGVTQPQVNLQAGNVTLDPVPIATVQTLAGARIGYLLFNDHVLTAERKLIDAITRFRDEGVQDLVVDLRYNRGGYLYLASELAYMIAGPQRTARAVFEQQRYSDKRASRTNSRDATTPFFNVSCLPDANFRCASNAALPHLSINRVWILTGRDTCSASEALINGLRGVDVDVRLIGNTTCGKPYGFFARDNCGISYMPMEFAGVNAKGFGDFASGFPATCPGIDDFSKPLGDPTEGLFQSALFNRGANACTTLTGFGKTDTAAAAGGLLTTQRARGHRILDRPIGLAHSEP